jgi:hypothetical protein
MVPLNGSDLDGLNHDSPLRFVVEKCQILHSVLFLKREIIKINESTIIKHRIV